jgi:hypothetical protein
MCKEYFSSDSNYWNLKFGKAEKIKISKPSKALYHEHLFLEVRRCVLKMCRTGGLDEVWCIAHSNTGLRVVQRICICMKWQDSEVCHPERRGLWFLWRLLFNATFYYSLCCTHTFPVSFLIHYTLMAWGNSDDCDAQLNLITSTYGLHIQ